MTVTVAKMNGKIVEIVRVAETVAFNPQKNWVMVCTDFEQPERKKQYFRWVPASTRFEWVRTFSF
jgi:hypothetical protein